MSLFFIVISNKFNFLRSKKQIDEENLFKEVDDLRIKLIKLGNNNEVEEDLKINVIVTSPAKLTSHFTDTKCLLNRSRDIIDA